MTPQSQREEGIRSALIAGLRNECERQIYTEVFQILTKDMKNWKEPIPAVKVCNMDLARLMKESITYFVGGAEIREVDSCFEVGSRGYYHYVGA